MISIRIDYDTKDAKAALGRMRTQLADRPGMNATVEVAAALSVKQHLTTHYAGRINRLGGVSTGYWKGAIEGTSSTHDAAGATVQIRQTGIRLKYDGGTIRASGRTSEVTGKPTKFLTIPVHPSAHGKTIADLGGKAAFYIVPFAGGGGLAEEGAGTGAGVFKKTGAKAGAGDPLYFILKRSVKVTADPHILPPDEQIAGDVATALRLYFDPNL